MTDNRKARHFRAEDYSQSEFAGGLESKHFEKMRSAALYIKPPPEASWIT
jgi:hypothetical protein